MGRSSCPYMLCVIAWLQGGSQRHGVDFPVIRCRRRLGVLLTRSRLDDPAGISAKVQMGERDILAYALLANLLSICPHHGQ